MRALFHAVPQADDEVAQLSWDATGLRLRVLQAGVILSELHLKPGAFTQGSFPDEFEVRVLAKHLRGALNTCIREDQTEPVKVEFTRLPNGLQIVVLTTPNRTTRKLGREGSSPIRMASLPTFEGAPRLSGLGYAVLEDGITALALLDMEYVVLRLGPAGLTLEAFPEFTPASFFHAKQSTTMTGFSRITKVHLASVADFGARHAILPTDLEVALLNEGLMRFTYALSEGTMTYWVQPRAPEI